MSVMAARSSTSSKSFPLRIPFSITSCRTVTFFATASLASFAASAYPILGASAVTSAGLRSSQCAHCAASASIPSTHRSANTRVAVVDDHREQQILRDDGHHHVQLELSRLRSGGHGHVVPDHLEADLIHHFGNGW